LSTGRLIEGDAYDIAELAGEKADIVVMANTFRGVPDKARLCRAVASALKDDGLF
jgi:predicted TPR repeat methyltransferase